MKKILMKKMYFVLTSMVFILAVLVSSTLAWFSQNAYVNTEAYKGTVDGGDASLLISLTANGKFDVSCDLIPEYNPEGLIPVSTKDLNTFFEAKTTKGHITTAYKEADLKNDIVYGKVYLKSINGASAVYFDPETFKIAMKNLENSGLRLGLKTKDTTLIFKLDNGENSEKELTITGNANSVVDSIKDDGTANFVSDPFKLISVYSSSDDFKGSETLFLIKEDEVLEIEYFVYLEGCDLNCVNNIQNKDLTITLGFRGEAVNE